MGFLIGCVDFPFDLVWYWDRIPNVLVGVLSLLAWVGIFGPGQERQEEDEEEVPSPGKKGICQVENVVEGKIHELS